MPRPKKPLRQAYMKYNSNRHRLTAMGVVFDITFDDWYQIWLSHGIDKNKKDKTHPSRDSLCMTRKDHNLPFRKDNIVVVTRGVSAKYPTYKCRTLGIPRPQTWKVKDPVLHEMYLPFLKMKAQAMFRARKGLELSTWELTFDEFAEVWGDRWALRGRGADDLAMSRKDPEGAWSKDNVVILTRVEQLRQAKKYTVRKRQAERLK